MTTTEHHYDYLVKVIGDIREASGLGVKPMLSELADAIKQTISDARNEGFVAGQNTMRQQAYDVTRNAATDIARIETQRKTTM